MSARLTLDQVLAWWLLSQSVRSSRVLGPAGNGLWKMVTRGLQLLCQMKVILGFAQVFTFKVRHEWMPPNIEELTLWFSSRFVGWLSVYIRRYLFLFVRERWSETNSSTPIERGILKPVLTTLYVVADSRSYKARRRLLLWWLNQK
jgi:hypothetical protein